MATANMKEDSRHGRTSNCNCGHRNTITRILTSMGLRFSLRGVHNAGSIEMFQHTFKLEEMLKNMNSILDSCYLHFFGGRDCRIMLIRNLIVPLVMSNG